MEQDRTIIGKVVAWEDSDAYGALPDRDQKGVILTNDRERFPFKIGDMKSRNSRMWKGAIVRAVVLVDEVKGIERVTEVEAV